MGIMNTPVEVICPSCGHRNQWYAMYCRRCQLVFSDIKGGFMGKAKQKLGPVIDDEVEGFCVKCKEKRVMDEPRETQMKNGNPAAKGTCPECGTGMFKILPKS